MKYRLLALALLSGVIALQGCGSDDNGFIDSNDSTDTDTTDGDTTDGGTDTPTVPIEEPDTVVLALGSFTDTNSLDTFQNAQLNVGVDLLSAGGQTTIVANVVNASTNNTPSTDSNNVIFTSECAQLNLATITSSVTTTTGTAAATYVASGCVGFDTITATLINGDTTLTATGKIEVASGVAGGIQFDSVANEQIAIKGYGSAARPESTNVIFNVVDEQSNPVEGIEVTFELTHETGGISLLHLTQKSDSAGQVVAQVSSGRVNSTFAVKASVDVEGTIISTLSNPISINTGLPDQNSLSLSVSDVIPASSNVDGTTVVVTARAADTTNNPARDGTIINFRTESGSIGASCTTEGGSGACSVNWVSQDPRPLNIEDEAWAVITAYTEGEETLHQDTNANGLYDPGEPFEALPEVFEDFNRDGQYDIEEGINGYDEYVDHNSNGIYDGADPSSYKGLRCSEDALAQGHCQRLAQVRDSVQLCIAGDATKISISEKNEGALSFVYTVKGDNGNSLPSGTTISIGVENGEQVGGFSRFNITTGGPEFDPVLGRQADNTFNGGNSCNEGFIDEVTVTPDPNATDPIKVTITVSTASGSTESFVRF